MDGRIKVILTPLGDKIKYRVVGRVICARLGEITNSGTYDRRDLVWLRVFGSRAEIARFLKRNRQVARITYLDTLGYDDCDHVQ